MSKYNVTNKSCYNTLVVTAMKMSPAHLLQGEKFVTKGLITYLHDEKNTTGFFVVVAFYLIPSFSQLPEGYPAYACIGHLLNPLQC